MTTNQIAYWNLREQERSNRARERETARTNKANERIKSEINSINLQLGQGNLAETNRANLARELELNRTNLSNEEIKRITNAINALDAATKMREADIKEGNLQLGFANLGEVRRSNMANESLKASDIAETNRANVAKETELNRSNIANENINRFRNATTYGTNVTSNSLADVRNAEQARHNRTTEAQDREKYLRDQQLRASELLETINRDKWNAYANFMHNIPQPNLRIGGAR